MDEELLENEITGTIRSVIYTNEENGYTVLQVEDEMGELVTVVGCVPYAAPGESLLAQGTWTNHPAHGKQFKAEYIQRMMPDTDEAVYEYLASGVLYGVGPATAALIVDRFGYKSIEVIENQPEEIAKIKGISIQKARDMSECMKQQTGMRRIIEFICAYGLRPVLAIRIYKHYGNNGLKVVQNNPYVISNERIGGTFSEADTLALELGVSDDSTERIKAATIFELVHNAGNGHSFIPREKLSAATAELISVDVEQVENCIDMLLNSSELVCEKVGGVDACYLNKLYYAEKCIAETLKEFADNRCELRADIDKLISKIEKEQGITYAPLQRKTLELALNNQVVILTGGPGTGKTTSVRAILAMFDSLGIDTLLAAPTGRAAKRMTELTGRDASTIHRMLGAKMSDDGNDILFSKNQDEKINCGALIIDECSMVDILLMKAVLDAVKSDCRLVLVGDADQLPSVGPGRFFHDIIRSEALPTVKLNEIFRQKGNSQIVCNAHKINKGEHPDFSENKGDFFRLNRLDSQRCQDTVVELFAERLPQKMNFSIDDIQVLTPTRKGDNGTKSLNNRLQAVLNPSEKGKGEILFGDSVYRVGDRVMQIRNNYDIMWRTEDNSSSGIGIFNGDIGKIISVNRDTEILEIDFDGHIARYGFDMLNEIEHAWAMTVHKSQGSEFKAVILVINFGAKALATRGVLYTAVTRAKEMLIIVGSENLAVEMIDNNKQLRRYSGLKYRLANNL